jgi:hypothetical protein
MELQSGMSPLQTLAGLESISQAILKQPAQEQL